MCVLALNDTTYPKKLFDVWEFMIREEYRSKLTAILTDLKEIKFANSRGIFKIDTELIKNVTSLLDYKYNSEGVFQRKHLLKHPEHGIRTFVYEIDLLNFLIDTIKRKIND